MIKLNIYIIFYMIILSRLLISILAIFFIEAEKVNIEFEKEEEDISDDHEELN